MLLLLHNNGALIEYSEISVVCKYTRFPIVEFFSVQVILNDFREKIEQHSGELVKLLIQKDDLETEQDSMLIDIEDISHSNDI